MVLGIIVGYLCSITWPDPQTAKAIAGYIGLITAVDGYNPEKGVKFSTYATHFVIGQIKHCLRDRGKIIKEPAWLHELSGKINRTTEALTQTLGRAPHAGEIAQVLNLTEEAVTEVLRSFGWADVVDIGGIDGSRELEAMCILWVKVGLQRGAWDHGLSLLAG